MNRIKLLASAVVLLMSFSFVACDNEPIDSAINIDDFSDDDGSGNGNGNGNGATGVFKVNFDGQTFTATSTQAIVNSDYIAITGLRSGSNDFFQITIPNGTVGTYTWDDFTGGTSDVLGLAYMNPQLGGSGFIGSSDQFGEFANNPNYTDTAEVNIISINSATNTITGTFKFTGVRFGGANGTTIQTKVFTQGEFNLTYTENVAPNGNTFFAKLDGADYNPTNVDGFKNSGKISIVGRRGNVENISIVVPDNILPGTYDFDFFGDYMAIYNQDSSGSNTYGSDSGSITITAHNVSTKKIVGTFNFVGTSFFSPTTKNITNGSFDVTYIE